MKSRLWIFTLAAALTMLASTAEAGKRHHDGYGKPYGHGGHGHVIRHYGHKPRYDRHRRHHQSHHRHHHGHRHGYGHHHYGKSHKALAGAILLGTIVTTLNRPQPAGVVYSGPGYAVRQPYAVNQNAWYQQDINGDCFEVQLRRDGQQVWTLTHPSNCY